MPNAADPLPLPLAPPVTVIHPALLTADHAHPPGDVTVADPVVAAALTDWPDGEIANVHVAGDCVTVTACPAIVSVPDRWDAFGFAAMLKVVDPLPFPFAPPVIVIHTALLAADHVQPVSTVTEAEPDDAAAPAVWLVGATVKRHGAAACVTAKICPAIVNDPERGAAFGFAPMLNVVDPLPLPLAPPVTVIQALLLEAVQAHPVGEVTVDEPVVAAEDTDWLDGEMPNVHGAAACVTVKVWPAIVSEPERDVAFGFAPMLKVVDPFPLPLAPPVTVIHAALVTEDHVHPVGEVTAADPFAPDAPADWLEGVIPYVQGAAACVTVNVCPAIVSVPVRGEILGFEAMLIETVPLPSPLVAPTSVSHAALLVADHVQPGAAVTFVEVDPPAAAAWNEPGAIEFVHGAPA